MSEELTEDEVFRKICVASRLENLGFFIGSGFTKALMIESDSNMLSWFELLNKICEEYEIEDKILQEGSTYPLIASKIIEIVSKKDNINIDEATKKVKNTIARLVNCKPSTVVKNKYNSFFDELKPTWIVTTNYDTMIETVVGTNAYPILPNYLFFNAKNLVPIYHIHGSILEPSSIVISNQDYARAMRPSDYRHSRLPMLFKESTVLMIGYALGDLNVISALDYRNNVYTNSSIMDNCIIQLVYKDATEKNKIYIKDQIIIYEFNDLSKFFTDLSNYLKNYRSLIGKETNYVQKKQNQFVSEDDEYVEMFIDNSDDYRNETINFINKLDISYSYIFSQYIPFLDRAFGKIYERAREPYRFSFYDDYLNILIDLIRGIDVRKVSTVYLNFLLERFSKIAPYIGERMGESFDAWNTWKNRKSEVSSEFMEMLVNTQEYGYIYNLRNIYTEFKRK